MTEYAGAKSLDAEITLDFIKKTVSMDYTLNSFGSPLDSNRSVQIDNSFRNLLFHEQVIELFIAMMIYWCICIPISVMIMPVITMCTEYKLITNSNSHYAYQKLLKYVYVSKSGIYEQTKTGKLVEPIITFTISNNIWSEYELDGEYQEKIKSISLKRHLITHYMFGKYKRTRQDGWDVIFEFTNPPQSGSCILRST